MRVVLSLLTWSLTACDRADLPCLAIDCEASDSAVLLGPPTIERVAWNCCTPELDPYCPEGGAFWYDVVLTGGTDSMVLECTQTDGYAQSLYQETHSIPVVAADANANWSNHYIELPVLDSSQCAQLSDCPDLYESGQSSLFSCNDNEVSAMNWTLRYTASEVDDDVGCGSWGEPLEGTEDCAFLVPDP